ncbi:phage tail protein [Shimia sp. Alg240-R146]|uniref:phage tail protein n=1 Tax=Shimia sp. Alg240-R146 TaxID=2993449 RepID=UPI0022E22095|nr:tail fiber protein [Shimia sp. Alg240-R146]
MKKIITLLFAATTAVAATAPIAQADEPFIGEIRSFGFNFCPRDWAPLNGQLLAISGNDALFSLLGTIYGGDGRTTFALPELRGRIPVGNGSGPGLTPRTEGLRAGTETELVQVSNMPSHTHQPAGTVSAQLVASSEAPTTNDPNGNYLPTSAGNFYASTPGTIQDMATGSVSVDISAEHVANTGGSQPVINIAPTLVTNYCIALFGIYPSRS